MIATGVIICRRHLSPRPVQDPCLRLALSSAVVYVRRHRARAGGGARPSETRRTTTSARNFVRRPRPRRPPLLRPSLELGNLTILSGLRIFFPFRRAPVSM